MPITMSNTGLLVMLSFCKHLLSMYTRLTRYTKMCHSRGSPGSQKSRGSKGSLTVLGLLGTCVQAASVGWARSRTGGKTTRQQTGCCQGPGVLLTYQETELGHGSTKS